MLSTTFMLLGLAAYVGWTRCGGRWRCAAALLFQLLGLTAKPMLVSFPLLLLCLDFWPLRRIAADGRGLRQCLCEKLPFLLLSLAAGVLTLHVQRAAGALSMLPSLPLGARLANAVVSYAAYLRQLAWPSGLAVFYPHPGASLEPATVLAATVLLVLISWLALRLRAQRPWLLAGWAFFLFGLAPVIGLVQAGAQGHADRYTYVPAVGLFLLLAWELVLVARGRPRLAGVLTAVAAVALAGCVTGSRRQVGFWRSQETLFRHALDVSGANDLAQRAVGEELRRRGRPRQAIPHLQRAVALRAANAEAWASLGLAYAQLGLWDRAVPALVEACRLKPRDPVLAADLALVCLRRGDYAEAEALYAQATVGGSWAEPWRGLGLTRLLLGRTADATAPLATAAALEPTHPELRVFAEGAAVLARGGSGPAAEALRRQLATLELRASLVQLQRHDAGAALRGLRRALEWDPQLAAAHQQLGVVLTGQGRLDEALSALSTAVRLDSASAEAHNDLGYVLLRLGRAAEAEQEFRRALSLGPELALAARNLSLAQAASRRQPRR